MSGLPAIAAGDALVDELQGSQRAPSDAPTMGRLKRLSYSHEALVNLIIEHPEMDQNHLAAAFGYTASWISNILSSDAFKVRLASRREEVIDPALRATLKERFEALARQSLDVLQRELEKPAVKPEVALRAAELGARVHFDRQVTIVTPPDADRLNRLAGRLLALQEKVLNPEGISDAQIIETARS